MTTTMQETFGKIAATGLILLALLVAFAPKAHAFGPAGSGIGGIHALSNNVLSHVVEPEKAPAPAAETAREGRSEGNLIEAIADFLRGTAPTSVSIEEGVPLG
ncbi:MAG: hypothetical protein K8I02_02225 [Candidatus Methylomirabilis sp.]|nr:hypothetical protein [Deltaproteobacteria bacterium]